MALSAILIWSWSDSQTLLGDGWGYAYLTSSRSVATLCSTRHPAST